MSHSYYLGTPEHQGMPISTVEREKAADVDATSIACGVTRNMFDALGLTRVPLFMTADYMRYINILENLEPVVKTKLQNPLLDFEKGTTRPAFCQKGAVASIVRHNGSNAMKVDFNAKDHTMATSYTAHAWDGEMYLFDGDITVSEGSEGAVFALEFCNAKGYIPASLTMSVQDGNILIGNEKCGLSLTRIAKTGETFNLHMEYTNSEREGYLDVYANGERVGKVTVSDTGDVTRPAGYPARAVRYFNFRSENDIKSTVYYDNMMFYYAKRK